MPRKPKQQPQSQRKAANTNPDRQHKGLFAHKEVVHDLLTGYVSAEILEHLDLNTLERCNGSYVAPELRERHNDIVWRVRGQEGWFYVYLLLEFQSTVDRFMAVRLLGYIALLWQDLLKQQQITEHGLLPPVFPMVLYNGEASWNAPHNLDALIARPLPALQTFQPQLRYLFLDEQHLPTSANLALHNLAAGIFAVEQTDDATQALRIFELLGEWVSTMPELGITLTAWAAEVYRRQHLPLPPEIDTLPLTKAAPMFATSLRRTIERHEAEGKAEGKAEAILALVRDGLLGKDVAALRLDHLLEQGELPAEVHNKARKAMAALA